MFHSSIQKAMDQASGQCRPGPLFQIRAFKANHHIEKLPEIQLDGEGKPGEYARLKMVNPCGSPRNVSLSGENDVK